MTARVRLLAAVHLARKQMGWDEETYRSILKRTVGKHSAGDCTDRQLGVLLDEFRKLGWEAGKRRRPESEKPHIRLIYALWGEVRRKLEGQAGDDALRSFVRRQTRSALHPDGVDAPEFLSVADAKRVIEGLKGWLARLEADGAASGGEAVP